MKARTFALSASLLIASSLGTASLADAAHPQPTLRSSVHLVARSSAAAPAATRAFVGTKSLALRAAKQANIQLLPVPTKVTIGGFSDIVVAQKSGHVFISGGHGTSSIFVTNLAGAHVKTIPNVAGASGMALSSDGSVLFVALADGDGIAEIDTTTMTVSKTVSTGVQTCPQDVAVTSGLVWFGYSCTTNDQLGALDPATDTVTLQVGAIQFSGDVLMDAVAAKPGMLAVIDSGLSIIDVNDDAGPAAALRASLSVGGNVRSLALTPDGNKVIVAAGSPYYHQVYKTADLSAAGTYNTGPYPNAVAVRHDGMVAAGIDGTPNVSLYKAGRTKPFRKYRFPASDPVAPYQATNGLAFGATKLYSVGFDYYGHIGLRVFTPRKAGSLSLKVGKHTVSYNAKTPLTIHLGPTSSRLVYLYAQPYRGPLHLVKKGRVNRVGIWKVSAPVTQATQFIALFRGDNKTDPVAATGIATAHAAVSTTAQKSYRKSGKWFLYHVRNDPIISALVKPNHAGGTVRLDLQGFTGGHWQSLASANVGLNATSRALAKIVGDHVSGERLRARATFEGDAQNAAKTGRWTYVKFTR